MSLRGGKLKNSGFTMVELLAAILISGIVIAGLYSVFISQQVAFSAQEQITEMVQNVRAAMDLMTREVRLAGYKNSAVTFDGIATAQASRIRILADLNGDGDTLDDQEDITYFYDASTQQILRNSVSLPVADHITNLSFIYTLVDGTTTSSPANLGEIRKVNITITARTAHQGLGTGGYRTITLTSDVTPRNLGL